MFVFHSSLFCIHEFSMIYLFLRCSWCYIGHVPEHTCVLVCCTICLCEKTARTCVFLHPCSSSSFCFVCPAQPSLHHSIIMVHQGEEPAPVPVKRTTGFKQVFTNISQQVQSHFHINTYVCINRHMYIYIYTLIHKYEHTSYMCTNTPHVHTPKCQRMFRVRCTYIYVCLNHTNIYKYPFLSIYEEIHIYIYI